MPDNDPYKRLVIDHYLPDEQLVGYWIDDKPIFRKIVIFKIPTTHTMHNVPFGVPIDNIIRIDALCQINNGKNKHVLILPYYHSENNFCYMDFNLNGNLNIKTVNEHMTNVPIRVILEYTKR